MITAEPPRSAAFAPAQRIHRSDRPCSLPAAAQRCKNMQQPAADDAGGLLPWLGDSALSCSGQQLELHKVRSEAAVAARCCCLATSPAAAAGNQPPVSLPPAAPGAPGGPEGGGAGPAAAAGWRQGGTHRAQGAAAGPPAGSRGCAPGGSACSSGAAPVRAACVRSAWACTRRTHALASAVEPPLLLLHLCRRCTQQRVCARARAVARACSRLLQ